MPAIPTALFDTAGDLLACALAALDANDLPEPSRAFVANGNVANDGGAECCGQLSVRLVRVYPSDDPPAPANDPTICATARLVIEWEVLYFTACQPQPDDNGNPPHPAALTTAAADLLTHLWVLLSGMACCVAEREFKGTGTAKRQGWVTGGNLRGPEGLCGGVVVYVTTVEPTACDCRQPA